MSSVDSELDVLFLPYYDDNPYQRELRTALETHGVTVRTGNHETAFPILQAFVRHRPDVLHLHWAHSLFVMDNRVVTFLLGLRLLVELTVCTLLDVPVVWTVHNTLDHERAHVDVELPFRQAIAGRCDALITHGGGAREEILDVYDIGPEDAARVTAIPHGNYIGSYENDVTKAEARDYLSLPADATVYLHFGNIRPYKGVDALVETFRALDDSDARLLIAGRPPTDPEARAALIAACDRDERIRTDFDYIPEPEIQHYFNAADAVVFPFEHVLTSGSVVLAMSFGRPVVAPRLGCIPDTVAGENDLLYDPTDSEGLRRSLERVREEDLSMVANQNRIRAAQCDWSSIAAQTRQVYLAAKNGTRDVDAEINAVLRETVTDEVT